VEANWQPSFALTIPTTWVTGLYVAKLTDAAGKQTYVSFVVRGNPTSAYVAVIPDTTTAAYNQWGGYSLYRGADNTYNTHATKVSFNRPALGWRVGLGQGLPYVIDAIRWLERQEYDVSYISSVDLHEDPGQLLSHHAYLSLGHDEYWSKEMRDGVEYARDAGVGLAFFGANAVYYQIRFEADRAGNRDRWVVCYKEVARDPLLGKDNSRVTVRWREAPVLRPENALVGIMYSQYAPVPQGFPWQFSPSGTTVSSRLLTGTGLRPGQQYGCDLVGYEWDRVFANGVSPAHLHVLSTSATVTWAHRADTSNSAYYVAPSGALVFASGSIYWSYALDDLHLPDASEDSGIVSPRPTCGAGGVSAAVPEIQTLMGNMMSELVIHHATDL
jgi:hypothetical protein